MKISKSIITVIIIVAGLLPIMAGCSVITGASPTPPVTDTNTTTALRNVSVEYAHAMIQANRGRPDFTILDVRTPGEYDSGHIEGAVNINFEATDFKDQVNKLEKAKSYLVYCRTGARSAAASEVMVGLDFHHVFNMTGGISNWEAAGYPVVKSS